MYQEVYILHVTLTNKYVNIDIYTIRHDSDEDTIIPRRCLWKQLYIPKDVFKNDNNHPSFSDSSSNSNKIEKYHAHSPCSFNPSTGTLMINFFTCEYPWYTFRPSKFFDVIMTSNKVKNNKIEQCGLLGDNNSNEYILCRQLSTFFLLGKHHTKISMHENTCSDNNYNNNNKNDAQGFYYDPRNENLYYVIEDNKNGTSKIIMQHIFEKQKDFQVLYESRSGSFSSSSFSSSSFSSSSFSRSNFSSTIITTDDKQQQQYGSNTTRKCQKIYLLAIVDESVIIFRQGNDICTLNLHV